MALTEKQYDKIREELDTSQNPLIFFDSDADGLCSFLLFYRYKNEGYGVIAKTHPKLTAEFARKIEENHADKVFVLDVADVEQEFIDASSAKVIWIDHHGPYERNNVQYFNPRVSNQEDNIPTTNLCYDVVRQDLWIATLGCIADYFMPPFIEEFREQYPDLIGDKKTVGDMYFDTPLGELIKIFSFCLKGKASDVMRNVKILTRIDSPYEILNKETARGKFLHKKYEKAKVIYEGLLKNAIDSADDSNLLVFTYESDKTSFTGDLSNELLYRFADKMIIVGRKKDGDVRMSLRGRDVIIPPILEEALNGLEGYGGGHEHACGCSIKEVDFNEFLDRIRKKIE